jgi:hypothetical protein
LLDLLRVSVAREREVEEDRRVVDVAGRPVETASRNPKPEKR